MKIKEHNKDDKQSVHSFDFHYYGQINLFSAY